MKILDRKKLASTACERWARVYDSGRYGEDKLLILENLKKLGKNPTPDDVDNIIGNKTWTNLLCSECGEYKEKIIIVGQEPNYESSTAYLCNDCVRKAYNLINKEK